MTEKTHPWSGAENIYDAIYQHIEARIAALREELTGGATAAAKPAPAWPALPATVADESAAHTAKVIPASPVYEPAGVTAVPAGQTVEAWPTLDTTHVDNPA